MGGRRIGGLTSVASGSSTSGRATGLFTTADAIASRPSRRFARARSRATLRAHATDLSAKREVVHELRTAEPKRLSSGTRRLIEDHAQEVLAIAGFANLLRDPGQNLLGLSFAVELRDRERVGHLDVQRSDDFAVSAERAIGL